MTDAVLNYLAKTAKHLSVLETTGCKGITRSGRKILSATMPKLHHVCFEPNTPVKPRLIEVNRTEMFKKEIMDTPFSVKTN
jgi:hypothetical protein